jgi:hypothetical protein
MLENWGLVVFYGLFVLTGFGLLLAPAFPHLIRSIVSRRKHGHAAAEPDHPSTLRRKP